MCHYDFIQHGTMIVFQWLETVSVVTVSHMQTHIIYVLQAGSWGLQLAAPSTDDKITAAGYQKKSNPFQFGEKRALGGMSKCGSGTIPKRAIPKASVMSLTAKTWSHKSRPVGEKGTV